MMSYAFAFLIEQINLKQVCHRFNDKVEFTKTNMRINVINDNDRPYSWVGNFEIENKANFIFES